MTEEEIKAVDDRLNEHIDYIRSAWSLMRQDARTYVNDKDKLVNILMSINYERAVSLNLTEFARQHMEEFVSFCQNTKQR